MISIATDILHAADPVAFAQDRLGFKPDPLQAALLRSSANYMLVRCPRQWGKSTATAVSALHTAKYNPGSLILLISPSLRQSKELFGKVMNFLKMLEPSEELIEDNKSSAKLVNGSRIVSLPSDPDTIRGFSAPAMIIEDEAAYVSDQVNTALRPMLAMSQGRLILLSTPNGRVGHFHDAWQSGGPFWERITVRASECGRYRADFLAAERQSMPEWKYQQEYEVEFTDTSLQMFGSDLIASAVTDEIAPLFTREQMQGLGAFL